MGCLVGLAVIVVILLIALVIYMANASGDSGDAADEVDTEVTDTEATEEQSIEDEEAALANPVECLPGALEVEIDLAGTTFDAGDQIAVPVTVMNAGDVPCLTDTGHGALGVQIHSGDDLIWNSKDCPSGAAERALLLDVGASDSRTITWDGTRGCDSDAAARAGTYLALAAVNADGGQASAEQAFTLD